MHQSKKGEVAARQRKTLEIYTGVDSIFAITEGNPRWFISLASPLINFLVRSGERKVPNSEQASEIDAAADRLIALLRTIPVEHVDTNGDDLPLDALLEEIGARLHAELVDEHFSMDPVQSFVVDEKISERTPRIDTCGQTPQVLRKRAHEGLRASIKSSAFWAIRTSRHQRDCRR
ncbi:ORC-CDC6 family AAA ATPase [Cupriavidus sp. EM10]|uniref:ORC-CDC6 family AAA ATPase n=1 Tax=Cupriavidus sp. EM10 TaxID=2839983 RepID=UPI001C0039C9|nr:hypothetical protein [Cupriavidus sp. EM10]QWE94150.1 hypothetical protein KLP38_15090 [Cupriavidus sp. EM10]